MEAPSKKNTDNGLVVAEFMRQVDELAHKSGIEVAIFAKKDPAGSLYSNVRDPEEAGSIITASILHSLTNADMPENANKFIEVFIVASAHTIEAMKGLKKDIIAKIFPKKFN